MKNEIEELMMLTPKRKSILWRYKSDEDESIFVYGISKGRAIALSGEFAVNKEEVLKNKEKVKQLKDDSDINDGGISVLLENVSARIWELCDGSNTLKDIVNYTDPENAAFISLVGLVTSLETASIEITKNCNLKCKHCYQGSHMDEQLMMNLNEVRSIASKLGELGTLSVVLTGGEPFLHPNLVEIVETFNNWNIRVVIFTNGQVIQNETIRKLSNMNVLVRISLEGHNEEINDFIRGVGTFKKAIEFSNICRENNLSIGYSFTINSINEKYFSDMLQLAEDSFADEIEMSEILNVNQNLNISSLMLSEKQSKNFRINTLKGFSISKAFRKGMGLYRYKKGTEYICSAGTKNIFIDINGDVYPCNLFANHNEYFAGNVFSEDLLEIWRKSKVFIELRNLKKEDIEECANCPASENCKGGCRARAVFESGSLRGKMEKGFCKVTNMMVEEMNHNAFVHN